MKGRLNWQDKKIVNVFDEGTIWSIPFGRLLLENIPMRQNMDVLDIGFGTGFPLVELSQRFGETSTVYGIDLWEEGIWKTKEKIETFGLENIKIFEQSAESIPLENDSIDLVCSNLGVNNFENKTVVLKEIFRVLKKDGHLSITTNPVGTFEELFEVFKLVLIELNLEKELIDLEKYILRRSNKKAIIDEIELLGFKSVKTVFDKTNIRFVNAEAIFDHSLMRIGFLEGWMSLVPDDLHIVFFEKVKNKIADLINKNGEFKMTIPMLYFGFKK